MYVFIYLLVCLFFYLQFQGLYLSDLSNAFQKPLKSMMKCHMRSNFVSSQNKIKVVALKITNNINVLIKVTIMNFRQVLKVFVALSNFDLISFLLSSPGSVP